MVDFTHDQITQPLLQIAENPFIQTLDYLKVLDNIAPPSTQLKPSSRAPQSMIAADNDLEAIASWLANFQGHTFSNYRREAERFLLWLHYFFKAPKLLKDVKIEDIHQYQAFCQNPQPVNFWCMAAKYPRQHRNWRPFYKPLQPKSIALSVHILNILFSWLQRAAYLAQNPFALLPKKQSAQTNSNQIDRYIPEQLWDALEDLIEKQYQQAQNNILEKPSFIHQQQFKKAIRQKWLIHLLYQTGMRISELIENHMTSFEIEYFNTDHQKAYVWLKIVGKRQKIRKIPASDDLLKSLALYRTFCLDLPPLPPALQVLTAQLNQPKIQEMMDLKKVLDAKKIGVYEDAHHDPHISLVAHIKAGQITTPHRSSIHNEVKEIFQEIYQKIIEAPKLAHLHALAPILLKASAHWVRHSIWTHMANHDVDLRVIRDNAGHASIATTNIYLHTEAQQRHEASVNFKKTKQVED